MPESYFGVVEMVFSFGTILAIAGWQLVSLEKAKKRTRERIAREGPSPRESLKGD